MLTITAVQRQYIEASKACTLRVWDSTAYVDGALAARCGELAAVVGDDKARLDDIAYEELILSATEAARFVPVQLESGQWRVLDTETGEQRGIAFRYEAEAARRAERMCENYA